MPRIARRVESCMAFGYQQCMEAALLAIAHSRQFKFNLTTSLGLLCII
jgi:hypothetical protein